MAGDWIKIRCGLRKTTQVKGNRRSSRTYHPRGCRLSSRRVGINRLECFATVICEGRSPKQFRSRSYWPR